MFTELPTATHHEPLVNSALAIQALKTGQPERTTRKSNLNRAASDQARQVGFSTRAKISASVM
eukprot:1978144-Amphidinium_carterae.1